MNTLLGTALSFVLLFSLVGEAAAQQIQQPRTASPSAFVEQAGERGNKPAEHPLRWLSLGVISSQLPADQQAVLQEYRESESEGNLAITNQDGSGNMAFLQQYGRSNIAVMQQFGSGNRTTLLQDGTDNIYSSRFVGDDNELDVEQRGDNNIYIFDFEGDDYTHSVVQEGNDIKATQLGTAHRPVSIEQRGNGMDVTVTHNGGR